MSKSSRDRPIDGILEAVRGRLLTAAGAAIVAIAWLDWYVGDAVTLGALYILPVVLLSAALSRAQILGVALLCAVLRLVFNPPLTIGDLLMSGSFAVLAYGLIGLFASEMGRNRREILNQLSEIQRQQALRRDAEEQLRLLALGSPAAIFTLDDQAQILSANRATHELLGVEENCLITGRSIDENLPVLSEALKLDTGAEAFRTVAQVQGKRFDGTPFLAQCCFSTYRTSGGSARLAAIAFDSTEETREREEQSQHQMLESNRIIAGAVAHEVRNVCGAMSIVYSNLERVPGLSGNRDYEALGHLLNGLGRLARLELCGREETRGNSADLRDVLNHLRILIEPVWEERDAHVDWPDLKTPLLVAADSFTLLQAFLNIANNSLSAMSNLDDKRLNIDVGAADILAQVSFADSGPGVADPDVLFQPFRSGSGNIGLGLYVTRALMRRYGGDVRYKPDPAGARFIVEIPLHGASVDGNITNERNPTFADR